MSLQGTIIGKVAAGAIETQGSWDHMKTLAIKAHMLMTQAKNDRGATAVEYGLIVALIAIVIIAALLFLGPQALLPFDVGIAGALLFGEALTFQLGEALFLGGDGGSQRGLPLLKSSNGLALCGLDVVEYGPGLLLTIT